MTLKLSVRLVLSILYFNLLHRTGGKSNFCTKLNNLKVEHRKKKKIIFIATLAFQACQAE